MPVLATKLCVAPTITPTEGSSVVAFAPFGSGIFRQHVRVAATNAPAINAEALRKPISSTKPLKLSLTDADVVNTYSLRIDGKSATCQSDTGTSTVHCDTVPLDLGQGKEYSIEVLRAFKDSTPITTLTTSIQTLTATAIKKGSVNKGQMVYSRPMEFTFTADKPLVKASAKLTLDGDVKAVASTTSVKDSVITVKLTDELPREKKVTLVITDVEANDGSSLADPYEISFKTSGGPRVTGVSVGKSGVSASARIVVTFDQELSGKQDIAKIASIAGGNASITRSGNQVIYSLQGLGLCKPFTLSIIKGIESKYDIASAAGWSYASRTVCHTTSVYGYSVQGRALVSYNFGASGPVTMYVGAIHGNESSSSGLMKSWIDDLEANPSLYSGKRVVIVPTINPDGLAAGTRTNSRGVNLNRNFPTNGWTKDINDTDGYHKGGGGSAPLSEPEAKALASLTTSLRPRLLLSFHAVGSLVTGDPGGYSAGYSARYASMVGYRDATGQSGTFDYDITGAYEDWTYSKQGIPSMVIELGSYGYYNFPHHQAALRAMLK